MSRIEAMHTGDEVVAAAKAGDESAFTALVERHRRELQVHCYRILGSLEDSEDALQETFLRAWRRRETYAGRAPFRAWLYRIATNACLDALERRPRKLPAPVEATGASVPMGPRSEVPWLQPYPEHLLAPSEDEPDAAVVAKETIELAFLVAIQHLPPRSRAVLILRDVLGWSAKETAALLETSVASVNSALQRARAALKENLPERRLEWDADASEPERALVERYVAFTEAGDADGLAALIREDATFAMPPEPGWWAGRDAMVNAWKSGGFGTPEFGDIRTLVTWANRQPAVANYVRKPGEDHYQGFALDVLRIEDGMIAEIVAFTAVVFAAFELPETI